MRGYDLTAVRFNLGHDSWFARLYSLIHALSAALTDTRSSTMPTSSKPLTEAALLKMPASAYMNPAQLAFFRARLEVLRDEMLSNAADTGETLKENENFADPNDRATVEEEHMLEQRVRDRERKLLKKIHTAISRIDSGEYGWCLETGEPIGLPRLLARPTAEYSIEAQERHEKMEKLRA
jgi:DnaK suppressor protein